MNWSSYQEKIFDFVENSNESAVINAKAGSGKSSTIIECAKRLSVNNVSILFLAFNKTIANELKTKMSAYSGVECKTLHSHGFSAIQSYKRCRLKLDDNKWYKYLEKNVSILSDADFKSKFERISFIKKCISLFNLCRINLLTSKDSEEDILDIAFHHGIMLDKDESLVVKKLLKLAYNIDSDNVIDYVDMIVLPCMNEDVRNCIKKYDTVFVDECQDLSQAQRILLTNSIKRGGRFISVGDPNQAITGFCGADCESFDKMKELAGGTEFPLSVCYRCGKNIIETAQSIVPDIQPFEGNCDGVVSNIKDISCIKPGDVILSRKSAPTIHLCLKFLSKGIPAKVKGKDMVEGLVKMVEKSKADSFTGLYEYLNEEYKKLLAKLEKKGIEDPSQTYQAICFRDKVDCIKAIGESCEEFDELINKFDSIVSDFESDKYITLSTIHKAKGLEYDRVFIILPSDLPLTWKNQQDWEYQQEMNLKYVAITRAKKELFFVDMTLEQLINSEL